MSNEVKRYSLSVFDVPFEGCQGVLGPDKEGQYVLYSDYEKLKAQLEKAEKIISYYASEDTWIKKEFDKEGNLHQWWDKTPNDKSIFAYSVGKSNGNFNCLGGRAREYFKEKGKV